MELRVLPNDPEIAHYPVLLVPQAIHARLSAKCNLTCFYCERENWASGDKVVEQDMREDVWGALVEKFLPGVRGVELCGLGEPTLAKLFPQAARDVVRLQKTLYFPTNGYFLDRPEVLASVGETPHVSVSLDAWDAESYRRIRGGDWDRVLRAVKTFRREKPQAFLHSQYTAGTYNIDGLPLFLAVCADLGIREVILRFVQNHTTAREDCSLRFARERTERAIEAARTVAEREKIWFTAERRPYSQENPNEADNPTAHPITRLRRYLDFVLFDVITDGDGSGSSATCPPDGSIGYTGNQDPQPIFPGLFAYDEGKPVIIRRPRAPRKPPPRQTMTAYSTAALVAAWDGALWSCFAGHEVGNVFQDDLASVIANPRYQAFLQQRQSERGIMQEQWCRHCPRVF